MRLHIWHNKFYLSKVFLAPDDGVNVGAMATAQASQLAYNGSVHTIATTEPDVDYKALYEAERAERAKLKTALDKSNSENADYKRKERDRMTQEEQAAADAKARDEELAQLRQEITESKVEKVFAGKGIDEKTQKELTSLYVPFLSREQSIALSEKIVAILSKQQAVAQEQSNNRTIVEGTVHPGSETSTDDTAEAKARIARMLGNQDTKKLEEQKNLYRL